MYLYERDVSSSCNNNVFKCFFHLLLLNLCMRMDFWKKKRKRNVYHFSTIKGIPWRYSCDYGPSIYCLSKPSMTDICSVLWFVMMEQTCSKSTSQSVTQVVRSSKAQFMFRNCNVPIQVAALSNDWVCRHSLAGIAGSNPTGGMDVCYVLQGRGLCVGLITRPEESYRL